MPKPLCLCTYASLCVCLSRILMFMELFLGPSPYHGSPCPSPFTFYFLAREPYNILLICPCHRNRTRRTLCASVSVRFRCETIVWTRAYAICFTRVWQHLHITWLLHASHKLQVWNSRTCQAHVVPDNFAIQHWPMKTRRNGLCASPFCHTRVSHAASTEDTEGGRAQRSPGSISMGAPYNAWMLSAIFFCTLCVFLRVMVHNKL